MQRIFPGAADSKYRRGCHGVEEMSSTVVLAANMYNVLFPTLPFGPQKHAPNLNLSLPEQPHLLPRDDPLTYAAAICNGQRNWRMITDAFAGGYPPGRDFTFDDLENGWSSEEYTQYLEDRWKAPLRYMSNQLKDVADNTLPDPDDMVFVDLSQDKEFLNDEGKKTFSSRPSRMLSRSYCPRRHSHPPLSLPSHQQPATFGKFQSLIMATHATIYTQYANSPSSKLRTSRTPPPAASLPHLVPPVHRLSDANWFSWTQVEEDHPERLRFIAHDTISNHNTMVIIDTILQAHVGDRPNMGFAWPGLSFEVGLGERKGVPEGDAEGLALLGTPNSVNVVWMLVERARALGKRGLRVHMFVEPGDDGSPPPFQPAEYRSSISLAAHSLLTNQQASPNTAKIPATNPTVFLTPVGCTQSAIPSLALAAIAIKFHDLYKNHEGPITIHQLLSLFLALNPFKAAVSKCSSVPPMILSNIRHPIVFTTQRLEAPARAK
ncbi:MAG: hypothetical protein LQ345_002676 [Seirophora villosa]|nr:MAG: hypothetical protein LQ345_002676 [Seirophora villosa]